MVSILQSAASTLYPSSPVDSWLFCSFFIDSAHAKSYRPDPDGLVGPCLMVSRLRPGAKPLVF